MDSILFLASFLSQSEHPCSDARGSRRAIHGALMWLRKRAYRCYTQRTLFLTALASLRPWVPAVKNDAVSRKQLLRKSRRACAALIYESREHIPAIFNYAKKILYKYIYYIYNVYIKTNNSFHKEKKQRRKGK